MVTMTLNKKLKEVRLYLNKSQQEMAMLANTAYSSWQKYEHGSSVPGGKVFEALVGLGFNISWFYNDDVPMLIEDSQRAACLSEQLMTPSPKTAPQGEGVVESDLQAMPSDSLGLGESVELLAKIYNSGNTVLVRAIAANLNAFSEAIDNKALAIDMKKRMVGMEQRITALEEKLTQATAAPPQKMANG